MLRPRTWILTLALASGLVGLGALPHAAPVIAQSAATPVVHTTTPMDAEAVVSETLPAVVTVINEQTMPQGAPTLPGMSPGAEEPTGIGTGFIIDDQGHVVTNEHVVPAATRSS